MTLELPRRRELTELVADHVLRDVDRDELPAVCTASVCPTISGMTVDRRDQVLMTFFSDPRFITSIFSRSEVSTNGPFFCDLLIRHLGSWLQAPGRLDPKSAATACYFCLR